MEVRAVKNQDIDRKKWDACVNNAQQNLPYAYSWYLDAVAENWDGLIYGNYDAIMPMVWLRKYGVPCMYQPYYCQQLGVFSNSTLGADVVVAFHNMAASTFPYIDTNLHAAHSIVAKSYLLGEKKNLLLQLNQPYAVLSKSFSANHKRNMAKAAKAGLVFSTEVHMRELKGFYLSSINRKKEKWFTSKAELLFDKLMDALVLHGKAKICVAKCEGRILAAMVIVPQGKRMISIINASNEEGKAKGASHFVHANVIEHLAEKDYVLDFEGSSIPSIARFYEGFGAIPEIFYRWQTNLLKRTAQRFL